MNFSIIGRGTTAVHTTCKRRLNVGPNLGLPFILEALGTLAGPAPDTEPNVEGKADNPEGVPCTQWLPTCVPLVF